MNLIIFPNKNIHNMPQWDQSLKTQAPPGPPIGLSVLCHWSRAAWHPKSSWHALLNVRSLNSGPSRGRAFLHFQPWNRQCGTATVCTARPRSSHQRASRNLSANVGSPCHESGPETSGCCDGEWKCGVTVQLQSQAENSVNAVYLEQFSCFWYRCEA